MVRRELPQGHGARPHLPKRTVRLRLTALYCTLFFPLGVVLVAITAVVTFLSLHPSVLNAIDHVHGHGPAAVRLPPGGAPAPVTTVTPSHEVHIGSLNLDVQEFLLGSAITLVAMTTALLLLGWLVAGRVLRPLRTITDSTRAISERDLHQRLALPGPRDELTELGDTIDALLARLERAFDSQRRFVANASHELRTPLTVDRAMLQVALSDPDILVCYWLEYIGYFLRVSTGFYELCNTAKTKNLTLYSEPFALSSL